MPHRFVCLLFLLLNNLILAQKDSVAVQYDTDPIALKEITEADLETYKNDPKFDYEIIKKDAPDWWISFKNWIAGVFMKIFEWIFGVEKATGAFNSFLQILPYLLLGILIFILIKFFLNVNARSMYQNKKNQALVNLSEEEHIIKNENIETLINNALSEDNYRLATRYYYLLILQQMTDKEIITWELQKTNEDYLMEIQETKLKDTFRLITRFYNYIWYGDFPLDKSKYEKLAPSFVTLKKMIANA